MGTSPAHLWVFEDNPRAKRFYAKQSFRFDGRRIVDSDTGLWEQRFAPLKWATGQPKAAVSGDHMLR